MSMNEQLPRGRETRLRRGSESQNSLLPLQRQLNRLFDDFLSDFPGVSAIPQGYLVPRINVREDENNVEVKAELPGVDENDIEVSLTEEGLLIRGERAEEREERQGGRQYVEYENGSFQRLIPLETRVDESQVRAEFRNGILQITLPKSKEARESQRRIPISSARSGAQASQSQQSSSQKQGGEIQGGQRKSSSSRAEQAPSH